MKEKAWEKIGHLYPKVRDEHGKEHTVIAWIWTRTVRCPNPACGCEMPLASNFQLSKKSSSMMHVLPVKDGNQVNFSVSKGMAPVKGSIIRRSGAKCMCCGSIVDFSYIRNEGSAGRMSEKMMAVVGEGSNSKLYFSPSEPQIRATKVGIPIDIPQTETPYKALGINIHAYGFTHHQDLFSARQLVSLVTLSDLIPDILQKVLDANGSRDYAIAVVTFLAFAIDKFADRNSTFSGWDLSRESLRNTFAMQTIQMSWDYAEANPFSNSTGCLDNAIDWIVRCLQKLPAEGRGKAFQADAQTFSPNNNAMVSTDPPYYDNIGYADLSDVFYVWLRRSLQQYYPDIFRTMLVPKAEELVANPFKFDGDSTKARQFFEDGMLRAFNNIHGYTLAEFPISVYYAFKQSDESDGEGIFSSGWDTMLTAIIHSGFCIVGTWPMRTELSNRSRGNSSNALASSIVIVCRKRAEDEPIITKSDFINRLKREFKPALQKLQQANIAPVDLAQSAIGPGMAVYSRYSQVLEADGTPMTVRSALQIINQELDLFLTEQDGELEPESRFCIDLYKQYAFNEMKFGEADVLARAKNTSVDALANCGVLKAQKGVVRLLTREELPLKPNKEILWLLTQQLTRAMETDGVSGAARIVANIVTSEPERAKALAYRLFTIAERKKWTAEAFAYNSLVSAWSDVQHAAAQLRTSMSSGQQAGLFD